MKRSSAKLAFITAALTITQNIPECSAREIFPQRYSLSADCVTAYDQKDYNTCWACSALGSFNTQMKNQGINTDLSPAYLAYTAYSSSHSFPMNSEQSGKTAAFYEGGTNSIAGSLITSWRGIVSEENLYGQDRPQNSSEEYSSIRAFNIKNPKYKPDYIVSEIQNLTPWVSEKKQYSQNNIKELVYNGCSVSATCSLEGYDVLTNTLNNKDKQYYEDGTDNFLHTVLIVGWNDSFSKMNFSEDNRPENNGAWLVKNSYGKQWGSNGCFWISYEDPTLLEAVAYTEIEQNRYQHNYQHDYFGWTTSLSTESSEIYSDGEEYFTGKMANVFTAENDEYISSVSICTIEDNVQYEISVCTGLKDPSDPESGKISEKTCGYYRKPGYHTVKLNNDVRIRQGELFSVIVKIFNPSSEFTIPIEASVVLNVPETDIKVINIHPTDMEYEIKSKESFIMIDDQWCDIMLRDINGFPYISDISDGSVPLPGLSSRFSPSNIVFGNVCAKAFSVPYTPVFCDANDDGCVNAADIAFICHMILDGSTSTSFGSENRFSDFNQDGKISADDLIILKNTLMN